MSGPGTNGVAPGSGIGGVGFAGRGCVMGLVIGLLLLLGLGYMWWQAYSGFNPPEHLKPYAFRESFVGLLDEGEGSGQRTSPLTEQDISFFLGAVDSIRRAWSHFEHVYDSARAIGDIDSLEPYDPMDLDDAGRAFWQVSMVARRGLVGHLNASGRSWNDYVETKARIVAAADITGTETRDSLYAFLHSYNFAVDDEGTDIPNPDLFARASEIRAAGLDSTEQALARSIRSHLLTTGIHAMVGTDEAFYGE